MKKFVSSKNSYLNALMWLIVFGLIAVLFIKKPKAEEPSVYIFYTIMIGIVAMLIWILLDTKYAIKEEIITFNSGPFRGKININSIRKIEHHSGLIVPVNYKPALNTAGLIVYYNKYDEIYISPIMKEIFLEELLKINPKIEVV